MIRPGATVALLALAAALPASAQQLPVSLVVSAGDGTIGSELTIDVVLNQPLSVIAFTLPIEYDPGVLTPVNPPGIAGPLWENAQSIEATNLVYASGAETWDPGDGQLQTYPATTWAFYECVDIANMTPQQTMRGPGIIARIRFIVSHAGQCTLRGGYHNYVDFRPYVAVVDWQGEAVLLETNQLSVPKTVWIRDFQAPAAASPGEDIPLTARLTNATEAHRPVTVIYRDGGVQVGTKTVAAPIGAFTVAWTWSTIGVEAGEHVLSAEVEGYPTTITYADPLALGSKVSPPPVADDGGGAKSCSASAIRSSAWLLALVTLGGVSSLRRRA